MSKLVLLKCITDKGLGGYGGQGAKPLAAMGLWGPGGKATSCKPIF